MKHIVIVLFSVLLSLSVIAQKKENKTTTYYFIRHAEKDRSDSKNRNPNLTEKGLERAKKWSEVLSNITFDAVYSTNYNRTLQTAKPTADKNNLEITIYDPRKLGDSAFLNATKGKTVLVVGHSNTTPAFVNVIIDEKKYQDIDDSNNANLYIITISESGDISETLLKID